MTTPVGPITLTITQAESPAVEITRTPPPGVSISGTGPQGAPGTKIYQTNGQPSNSVGLSGDYAIDNNTGRFYGPKVGGTWSTWSQIPTITETGWHFNGQAELQGSDVYLTEAGGGFGGGSAWFGTAQATEDLDVTFDLEMSGGTGADGITFAFADAATANTFVGGGGGDLGLVGTDSVAIAFVTAPDELAKVVTTDESSMTTVVASGALDLRPDPFTVRIRYDDGVLFCWINGAQIFNQTISIPSSSKIGFTAANGGSDDNHIVRNVEFVPSGGMMLRGDAGPQGDPTVVNGKSGSTITLDSTDIGSLAIASNLSDLASVSTARTSLGLGDSAVLNIGTGAGTVAAGDDSRIVGAAQSSTPATFTSLDATAEALGIVTPRNRGLIAWSTPPATVSAGTTMTLGTVYLVGVYVNRTVNATSILWGFTGTAVTTPTSGQNFVGLYNSSGTRLVTAGVDAPAAATGLNTTSISSTALTPGLYWVGLVFNGAGAGTAYRASSLTSSVLNIGVSAATYQFATNGTAQTSLPSSITPSSNTGSPTAFFVAIG